MTSLQRRCSCLLVAIAIISGFSPRIQAHEIRPALLEITETTSGFFSVTWKVPMRGDRVLGVEPAAHVLTAPVDGTIVVQFDKPVKRESLVPLRTFWAFGRWSGTAAGTFGFSNDDRTVSLIPDRPFSAGGYA